MDTFFHRPSGFYINHNSDYTRDVFLHAPNGEMQAVPFEVFKAFVADYLRGERIRVLESATDDELLGLSRK